MFFLSPASITSRRSRHCVPARSLRHSVRFGGRWTVDGKSCFWQRSAALSPRSGTGLAIGETGQAEPDWPAQQTNSFLPPAKQPHFPGRSSGHHFRRDLSAHHFLRCSSQHHFLKCSSPALRPLMLLSALRPPMLYGALRLIFYSSSGLEFATWK